ncbi:Hpt domain-containing protein [Pseudomaricurvus sp.]|uniref:hybrid sensor histidine kinase/response regulator n=1 Tax=Pseudomaricurvus sp. TaxID=2004510 RepID=UPI003F6BC785
MADNRNFAALEWVIGEIDETLKQARQSLEAYVDNPQDSTRIRFCLTHIHQVHGSLQMVEFFGAALLAEEMEAIAQALMNDEVSNQSEAHEVLMRAILQLPIYLDQVKAKRNDDPGSLLPILNDLRAARGSTLLSESQFFNPDIAAAKVIQGKKNPAQANPEQFKAIIEKLRKMYQYAAAGVIRGVKVEENLDYLQKVFARLYSLTAGTGRQRLWDIALAVVEGLSDEQIEISVSLKTLMRQLDKEIRLLEQHGVKALKSFTRDELIKNLLYYVARSQANTPRADRLRQEFSLHTALPEQLPVEEDSSPFSGPDPETMRTVVGALNDELSSIKEALDEGLSGDDASVLSEALPVMKRVADTLAVLGVADLRKKMLTQVEHLEAAIGENNVSDSLLTQVADEVLAVEQSLDMLAAATSTPGGQPQSTQQIHISQAQETVLREARNGLEHAKDAIIEYIASQWDRSHLAGVPQQLEEIRGGLAMIPLSRPAAILKGCSQYIETELLANEITPEWSSLDTLADAIASVEYFLERLSGDRDDDDDVLLTLAEESIDSLGYGIAGTAPSSPAAPKPPVDAARVLEKFTAVESVAVDTLPPEAPAVDEETTEVQLTASDDIEVGGETEEERTIESPSEEELSASDDNAEESVDVDATQEHTGSFETEWSAAESTEAESAETVITETLSTEAISTETISTETNDETGSESEESSEAENVNSEAEDDEVDEEILEIFVEEAGEVLEAIDEFFPQWAQDFDDKDSLTEFRRAFHTLKGSGRMVGANDLGELAWSIENMLNRILDGSVASHAVQVELITRVRAILPEFIHAFENKLPNPNPELAEQLAAWAEAICRGEQPDELLGTDSASAASESDEASVPANEPVKQSFYEDDDSDDDGGESNAILWEIFGSEAITHLQVVEQFIEEMQESAPLYTPPSEGMQRALHTLKGSAHMADVHDIAELATPLERFAKELRTYQVNIDDDILQLFKDGVAYTHEALEQIRGGGIATIAKLSQFLARVAELRDLSVGPLIRQQEQREEKVIDPKLLSIFMAEEMNLLLDADVLISQWRQEPGQPEKLDLLIAELNTLAKGAEHAHLLPMSLVSRQLAAIYQAAGDDLSGLGHDDFETLLVAHEKLLDMVDAVAAGQNLQETDETLDQQLKALQQMLEGATANTVPDTDADAEGESDTEAFKEWSVEEESSSDLDSAPDSAEELSDQELSDAIEVIDVNEASELDVDVAEGFIQAVGEPVSEGDQSASDDDHSVSVDDYSVSVDVPSSSEDGSKTDDPELDITFEFDSTDVASDSASVSESVESESHEETDSAVDEPSEQDAPVPFVSTETAVPEVDEAAEEELDDDIDPEIIEIFLEEADELMEEIEQAVHDWSEDWSRTDCSEELKRALHTLKGGARLSGMTALGDVSHDFETDVINLSDNAQVTQDFFDRVNVYQDQLLKGIEDVKAGMAGEGSLSQALTASLSSADDQSVTTETAAQDEIEAQQSAESTGEGSPEEPVSPADPQKSEGSAENNSASVLPFTPKDNVPVVSGESFQLPPTKPETAGGNGSSVSAPMQTKRSAPQEVVKVSAELLEELVNLAGETSISRGRMEEQVSELGFAIDEMDSTIARLQEQLRRLDIETEAQILFRQEQMAEQDEFDPLEMDRYSQLQQLSRSLIESASDLMDLKSTLSDKTRDTETLLLQQSRINTDLQEGLMRSRMVPFSRLVPRLRRIVRQVSGELDKRVNFELDNVEGELDRTVLERMVAPLEHMLRNAVDHGIEPSRERTAAGKSESGRIVLTVGREGGDVILRLIDDGRGINLERVREKAIERGLMSEEAKLSDREIMQFILHAGFSTAESVTQISGRGVGMDVVHSEIKQLGGAMSINSRAGEGTEFTIRLPFTVSVNRALMVRIGDDRYAIPLNTIEGIVRVSPFELEHYYQDPEARFEYAGEQYKVNYLGNLLNSDARPKLEGQAMPLPVVLVRTAQHAVAMQVDMLMGSREVVVKSLGPQFATVLGVSGATVMGDGSVVVILDPHAMIRQDAALLHDTEMLMSPVEEVIEERVKTVMVVDDSVTVRKVTSRFLEREGYEVITAKDGADALLQLQDHIPDVMLLDIEMPRMDGFEVAKNIRSSSRLKHIPIIMITSRTGDKHRERAFSLGVDRYLGKPYQEDNLLRNILAVTGEIDDSEMADESADAPLEE